MLRPSILALVSFLLPLQAHAQCGGGFRNFVQLMKEEALTGGYDSATVNRFFENDDMSSDKECERHSRRKSKGSCLKLI